MATDIDNRVVYLQFNNTEFEKNVAQTNNSLTELKENLEFKNVSTKSLVQFGDEVSSIGVQFSALQTIAVSALSTIVSKAVSAGAEIVKSMSIEPITSGWSKYETKLQEVQKLVNNMDSNGKTEEELLTEVEAGLDRIETFADETSVSYETLVESVGDLVASGHSLDESIRYVEGFAVGAAHAGSNVTQTAKAVEGWTKAMNNGVMTRYNWETYMKSAGLNTKLAKEQLIEYAAELGTITKIGDDYYAYGSSGSAYMNDGSLNEDKLVSVGHFTESLTEGLWLNEEVMKAYAVNYGNYIDEIIQLENGLGISFTEARKLVDSENTEFYKFSQAAVDAAQQSKTLTDAIEATWTAVSTAWSRNFQRLFGQYKDAPVVWGQVGEDLLSIFTGTIYTMEDALEEWADLGGRLLLTNTDTESGPMGALFNILGSVDMAYKAVKDGIATALFGTTDYAEKLGQVIYNVSDKIQKFTQNIADALYYINEDGERVPTDKYYEIQDIFSTITQTLKTGFSLVSSIVSPIIKITTSLAGPAIKSAKLVLDVFNTIVAIVKKTKIFDVINSGITAVVNGFKKASELIDKAFTTVSDTIVNVQNDITNLQDINFDTIKDKFVEIGNSIQTELEALYDKFYNSLPEFGKKVVDKIKNIITEIASLVSNLFNNIKNKISGSGILSSVTDVISDLSSSLTKKLKTVSSSNKISSAFSTVTNVVTSALNKLKGVSSSNEAKDAEDSVEETIENLGDTITETSKKVTKKIAKDGNSRAVAFQPVDHIYKACIQLPNSIPETKAEEGITSTIENLGDSLETAVAQVDNDVIYSNDSSANTLFDWIQNIIKNINEFVQNFTLSGAISKIIDVVKKGIDIVFNFISYIVGKIKETLVNSGAVDKSDSFLDVLNVLSNFIKAGAFAEFASAIRGFSWNLEDITWSIKNGNLTDVLKQLTKLVWSVAGSALLLFGALMAVLKLMNFEKMLSYSKDELKKIAIIAGAVAAIFAGILSLMKSLIDQIGNLAKSMSANNTETLKLTKEGVQYSKTSSSLAKVLGNIALAMFAFAAGVALLGVAVVYLLKNVKLDDIGSMLVTLLGVFPAIIGAMILVMQIVMNGVSKLQTSSATLSKKSKKIITAKNISSIIAIGAFLILMGAAILLIAKAIDKLGNMRPAVLAKGLLAFTLIFAAMAILLIEMALLVKVGQKNQKSIKEATSLITSIAVAVLIITIAIKLLGNMKSNEIEDGVARLLMIMGIVSAFLILAKLFGSTNKSISGGSIKRALSSMTGVIALIIVLIGAVVIMSFIDEQDLTKSLNALQDLLLFVVVLLAAIKSFVKLDGQKGETTIGKVAGTVIALAALILVMALVTKILGEMETAELIRGVIGLAAVTSILVGFIALLSLLKNELQKINLTTLVSLVGMISTMAGVVKTLGSLSVEELRRGTIALVVIVLLLDSLIVCISKANNMSSKHFSKSMAATVTGVIILLIVMVVAVMALSYMMTKHRDSMLFGLAALAVIIGAIAGMMYIISKMSAKTKFSTVLKKVGKILIVMSAVMALVVVAAGVIWIIDKLITDPKTAIQKVAVVSIFTAALIGLAALCGLLGEMWTLILLGEVGVAGMAILVTLVAGVVWVVEKAIEDPASALKKIVVVSLFTAALIVLSAACALLGLALPYIMLGEIGLLAMTALMFLIVEVIKSIDQAIASNEIDAVIKKLEVLVLFAASLEVLALGCAALGYLNLLVIAGAAILDVFSNYLIPVIVQLIKYVDSNIDIGDMTEKRIDLLISLAAQLELLGLALAPLGALSAIIATGAAILAGVALEVLVGGAAFMKYLNENEDIPNNLEDMNKSINQLIFLQTLTEVLIELGNKLVGLGIWGSLSFIGGIALDGIITTLAGAAGLINRYQDIFEKAAAALGSIIGAAMFSSLPTLGSALSEFAKNAGSFFSKIKDLKIGTGDGFKSLAEGVVILLQAGIGEAFTSLFSSTKDADGNKIGALAYLGTQLAAVGPSIGTFIQSVKGVTKDDMDVAIDAVASLSDIAQKLPSTSVLARFFSSKQTLGEFAADIGEIGTNLQKFNDVTVDPDTLKKNMDTLSDFITELDDLPDTSENLGMSDYAAGVLTQMIPVYLQLISGLTEISGFNDINPASIVATGTCIANFMTALSDISHIGFDADDIDSLKTAMTEFSSSIPTFMKNTFDGVSDPNTFARNLKVVCEALKYMAEGLKVFSTISSLDEKISALKTGVPDIGTGLKNFYDNAMTGTKTINTTTMSSLATCLKEIATALEAVPTTGGAWGFLFGDKDLTGFGDGMGDIGTGLKNFIEKTADITEDDVEGPCNAIGTINGIFQDFENHGGVWQKFTGDNDSQSFATGLDAITSALITFTTDTKDLSTTDVQNGCACISAINAEFLKLENNGGLISLKEGDNKPEDFAEGVKAVANALKQYAVTVRTITDSDYLRMGRTTAILESLADVQSQLVQSGHPLTLLSDYIQAFAEGLNIDVLKSNSYLIGALMTLVGFIGDTMRVELILIASDVSSTLLNTMSEKVQKKDYEEIGKNIILGLKDGITKNQSLLTGSSGAITGIAKKMPAQLCNVLGIESPSKVFAKIGQYVDQGLVKGINEYSSAVYKSSSQLGDGVISTVTSTVYGLDKKIKENSGDTSFTIRPVVDMSQEDQQITDIFNGTNKKLNINRTGFLQTNISEIVNGSVIQNEKALLNTIEEMRTDIQNLGSQMEGMQVVLDGQTLVGGIANRMDKALGAAATRRSRGGL